MSASASEDEYDGDNIPTSPVRGAPQFDNTPSSPLRDQSSSSVPGSSLFCSDGLATPIAPNHRQSNQTAFAEECARHLQLKPDDCTELLLFGQRSDQDQNIWIASRIMKLAQHQATLQPADVTFTPSDTMKTFIDRMSFTVITSHNLTSYKTAAFTILKEKFLAESAFASLGSQAAKMDIIHEQMQNRLSDRRYSVKDLIRLSIGDEDPIDNTRRINTQSITQLCLAVVKLHQASAVVASVELTGRLAFLRNVYFYKESGKKYYRIVGNELKTIREKNKNDARKISKVMKKILDKDEATFDGSSLNNLPAGVISLLPIASGSALA